ncbi:hypothetical protein EG850_00135 [Gulosibacter macacae]|uniref:Ferritin-like domain-containing protein n=1 Tax=Gulosibacter macacae TaxID=2488791 RepID=A0A3P3W2J9_9MICO|nr:ferritin-like fold-containing protein [Gulosibacter macacae]RRJ88598.1 hypothetical protein EG850_00135 [Gulosibacter macacae]
MTSESVISALVLSPDRLHALLAQLLSSFEADLAALVGEFDGASFAAELVVARDSIAGFAAAARAEAPADNPEAVVALVDGLRVPTRGRDRFERLLTTHSNLGFAEDGVRQQLEWLIELGRVDETWQQKFEALLGWDDAQTALVAALKQAFEEDTTVDDRLAMWGRRNAGDAAVWGRQLCGIEPGTRADDVIEGAEEVTVAFLAKFLAQHSRRMNALALAA